MLKVIKPILFLLTNCSSSLTAKVEHSQSQSAPAALIYNPCQFKFTTPSLPTPTCCSLGRLFLSNHEPEWGREGEGHDSKLHLWVGLIAGATKTGNEIGYNHLYDQTRLIVRAIPRPRQRRNGRLPAIVVWQTGKWRRITNISSSKNFWFRLFALCFLPPIYQPHHLLRPEKEKEEDEMGPWNYATTMKRLLDYRYKRVLSSCGMASAGGEETGRQNRASECDYDDKMSWDTRE